MSFKIRHIFLWIHRYSGLFIAIFLVITAVTGALLSFHDELDDVFNHNLANVETQNKPIIEIAKLHDTVQARFPDYTFSSMPVSIEPGKSVVFTVDRQRGSSIDNQLVKKDPPFQQVFVNPYDADIIGTRNRDAWAWQNTMYKVFWLHRDLLLGKIGKLILGITALVWTINCFIGFYLTFPRSSRYKNTNKKSKKTTSNGLDLKLNNASFTQQKKQKRKRRSFFKRWLPAWKIRRKTNFFKLNYDLHHAFGLWLWIMLFVIAWSAVGFNLRQVYQPVMGAVIGLESKKSQTESKSKLTNTANTVSTTADIEKLKHSHIRSDNQLKTAKNKNVRHTSLDKHDSQLQVSKYQSIAYLKQKAMMVSGEQGLIVEQFYGIRWIAESQQWQMRFKTNKDIGKKGGVSSITVDAVTGDISKTNFGYQNKLSNKTDQFIKALHMGHIGNGFTHVLYQVFLALVGIAIMLLSLTGVYLWWRGRGVSKKSE